MVNGRAFAALVISAVLIFLFTTLTISGENKEEWLAADLPFSTPNSLAGEVDDTAKMDAVSALAGDACVCLASRPRGEHLPLMIRWSNWRPEFGPAYVYARAQDLSGMLAMEGDVEKMLMATSFGELNAMMARGDELHAAGVTTVGLNTENGLTPPDEMRTLNSTDPDVNIVARMAELARENGFSALWGPVRITADEVSDAALRAMMASGVEGLAIQEQKFIEVAPAQVRYDAVLQTRGRYLRLADELGIEGFGFHVQIMQQRCPDLGNCVEFVRLMEDIPVTSIAIWSNGPIPLTFVEAIRDQ